MRWLIGCCLGLLVACEAEPTKPTPPVLTGVAPLPGVAPHREPGRASPPTTPTPTLMLEGPRPEQELRTPEMPTGQELRKHIAVVYSHPELLQLRATPGRYDVTNWARSYDGIQLEFDPITAPSNGAFITRWIPDAAEPPRVRRPELIGEKKAIEMSGARPPASCKLMYRGRLAQRQLPGTKGNNADHFVRIVESYSPSYVIEDSEETFILEPYTGQIVARLPNGPID